MQPAWLDGYQDQRLNWVKKLSQAGVFDVTPRPRLEAANRKGSVLMPGAGSRPPAPVADAAAAAALPGNWPKRESNREGSGISDTSSGPGDLSDTGEAMESEVVLCTIWPSLRCSQLYYRTTMHLRNSYIQ